MTTRPFRFIHASDFHLERPVTGLSDVPDHLRQLFLDAPYIAAKRVFDAVLAEECDFLILSGNILQAQLTGPRGPLFLIEQFARLAERDIPVYWAGGSVDSPDNWPEAVDLPGNVHVFAAEQMEQVIVLRDDRPLAQLVGASRTGRRAIRPGDIVPDPSGLYTIAVLPGELEPAGTKGRGVDYWALGGRHMRETVSPGPPLVHYCGSPQGRTPDQPGPHGCTLVHVEQRLETAADANTSTQAASAYHTRTVFMPTDAVRWLDERVSVDQTTGREELQSLLRDRVHALLGSALPSAEFSASVGNNLSTCYGQTLLICWTIAGQGPLLEQLRRGALASEMLDWLRGEFGFHSPAAWSVWLRPEISTSFPPQWYEQDTILGDFLRTIQQLQTNPAEPLNLESYLPESFLSGELSGLLRLADNKCRDRVLQEAAVLGVDLLGGEEAHT